LPPRPSRRRPCMPSKLSLGSARCRLRYSETGGQPSSSFRKRLCRSRCPALARRDLSSCDAACQSPCSWPCLGRRPRRSNRHQCAHAEQKSHGGKQSLNHQTALLTSAGSCSHVSAWEGHGEERKSIRVRGETLAKGMRRGTGSHEGSFPAVSRRGRGGIVRLGNPEPVRRR
jgi:hypothetical protein